MTKSSFVSASSSDLALAPLDCPHGRFFRVVDNCSDRCRRVHIRACNCKECSSCGHSQCAVSGWTSSQNLWDTVHNDTFSLRDIGQCEVEVSADSWAFSYRIGTQMFHHCAQPACASLGWDSSWKPYHTYHIWSPYPRGVPCALSGCWSWQSAFRRVHKRRFCPSEVLAPSGPSSRGP